MKLTKHIMTRMSQRGITGRILEMVYEFGESDNGEKIILNRKTGRKVLEEIDHVRKFILKLIDKGGVVLVADGEDFITTYNVDSYKRGRC